MADLDDELIARAIRWCADAGRHASPGEVRSALAALSWDQLLTVRAVLADPPPARPLGPRALADLGRGTPPEVAARRERDGQYATEADVAPESRAAAPGAPPLPEESPRSAGRTRRRRGAAAPVIHRARDRVASGGPTEPTEPADRRAALESLLESEGRAVLERLIRTHGARRAAILQALSAGWRRLDGTELSAADLEALLRAHGLSRAFERREHDELLHALRASAGIVSAAAARIGVRAEEFLASLERLGASERAEEIREVHRTDVRRRATLAQRVRLLLAEADRLADLGMLREVEEDLRTRLPEHVRALRASGAFPLATALTHTLAMGPRELSVLLDRLGLVLDLGAASHATGREERRRPAGAQRPTSPRRAIRDRPRGQPRGRPPRSK
jgi:hypothetical protein